MGRSGGGRRGGGGGYPGGGRSGGGRGENLPGVMPIEDTEIIIEHTDSALKVAHRLGDTAGGVREFVQLFSLDGSESVNKGSPAGGEMRSRTSWSKDKLTTLGTIQPSDSNNAGRLSIVFKEEYSLSKDGKTLTMKTSRSSPRGKATLTETFSRKPDTAK